MLQSKVKCTVGLPTNIKFSWKGLSGTNTLFRIDATYEMRTTEHSEICISNDNKTIGEEGFYLKRKGEVREQTDGETERERACVCVLVNTDDSIGQHPQTSWDRETHLAIIDRRHL